jgi:hypothetical protein
MLEVPQNRAQVGAGDPLGLFGPEQQGQGLSIMAPIAFHCQVAQKRADPFAPKSLDRLTGKSDFETAE